MIAYIEDRIRLDNETIKRAFKTSIRYIVSETFKPCVWSYVGML